MPRKLIHALASFEFRPGEGTVSTETGEPVEHMGLGVFTLDDGREVNIPLNDRFAKLFESLAQMEITDVRVCDK